MWNLAEARLVAYFYDVHRLIFGSQISALQQLNTAGPLAVDDMRRFFDTEARGRYPDIYDQPNAFELWIGFLEHRGLVVRSGDKLEITHVGRDFLVFLTRASLSFQKYA